MEGTQKLEQNENYPATFFSIPNMDGSFDISQGKKMQNEGMVFYKIIPKSSNVGELQFITSDNDRRAMNRYDGYLKHACDCDVESFNKISDGTANQIKLLEPGEVRLVNDKWIITKKCKIEVN